MMKTEITITLSLDEAGEILALADNGWYATDHEIDPNEAPHAVRAMDKLCLAVAEGFRKRAAEIQEISGEEVAKYCLEKAAALSELNWGA